MTAATTATTTSDQMLLRTAAAISAGVWVYALGPQSPSGTVGTMATTKAMTPEKLSSTSSSEECPL